LLKAVPVVILNIVTWAICLLWVKYSSLLLGYLFAVFNFAFGLIFFTLHFIIDTKSTKEWLGLLRKLFCFWKSDDVGKSYVSKSFRFTKGQQNSLDNTTHCQISGDSNQCANYTQNKIYTRNVPDNRLCYQEHKTDINVDYRKSNRGSDLNEESSGYNSRCHSSNYEVNESQSFNSHHSSLRHNQNSLRHNNVRDVRRSSSVKYDFLNRGYQNNSSPDRVEPYHVTELIMTSTAKRNDRPVMTSHFVDENDLEVEKCLFKQSYAAQQVARQNPLSEIQNNSCGSKKSENKTSKSSKHVNIEEEQIYERNQATVSR